MEVFAKMRGQVGEELSSDARILWELIKKQPQSWDEIRKNAKVSTSQLYRKIKVMIQSGVLINLKEKESLNKGLFALKVFQPIEEKIREHIKLAMSLFFYLYLCRGSTLDFSKTINMCLEVSAYSAGKDPMNIQFRQTFFNTLKEFMEKPSEFLDPKLYELVSRKLMEELKNFEEELKKYFTQEQVGR
ncbi:MAG: hypothetical protein QXR89_07050 [Candidatus Bathyarchaeia archaeon]